MFFFLAVVLVVPEFLRDIWRFFYTYKTVGCFWPRSWVQCLKTMRRNKLKVRVLKIPFLPFWSHKTETVFVCFCFFLNKRNIYWWDQPSFMRMANCTGQKKTHLCSEVFLFSWKTNHCSALFFSSFFLLNPQPHPMRLLASLPLPLQAHFSGWTCRKWAQCVGPGER